MKEKITNFGKLKASKIDCCPHTYAYEIARIRMETKAEKNLIEKFNRLSLKGVAFLPDEIEDKARNFQANRSSEYNSFKSTLDASDSRSPNSKIKQDGSGRTQDFEVLNFGQRSSGSLPLNNSTQNSTLDMNFQTTGSPGQQEGYRYSEQE